MRPYYQDESVTLFLGDCRDVVGEIAADLVLTDPPYGDTSLPWDRYSSAWLHALGEVPQLWCFGSMRFWLENGAGFYARGWKLAQEIVWEKHNGSNFLADRFRRVHELAVHWYKGEWRELFRDVPKTFDARRMQVRRKRRAHHWGQIENAVFRSEDGGPRLMRSVLRVRSCHGAAAHPTQKPIEILEPLIACSCPPGGTVLDPFAGSGSTLIAAKRLGRRAVGVEAIESYCEAAAKRLSQGVLEFP